MSQFGVLVTWREVTGTEPTMALLHERIAPFRLEAVIVGLARVAAVLETWVNAPAFTTDQSLAKEFLPTYYPRIKAIYDTQPNRVTFTRISLLFVLKQAASVCQDDGRHVENAADVEQLLSCCLLANDLLLGRLPTRRDTTMEKAVNLLPFTNYVPQNTYPTDLARNLLLINDIAPRLAHRATMSTSAQHSPALRARRHKNSASSHSPRARNSSRTSTPSSKSPLPRSS